MGKLGGSRLRGVLACAGVAAIALLSPLDWSYAGSTAYTYDELGRLTSATYADGTTVNYSYDAAGNRTQLTQVSGANLPPVAVTDNITTPHNAAVTFDSRINDTDPNGNALTVTGETDGTHGTVVINSGASLTYTPASSYVGSDSFTYTISDGHGGSATGTVSVTVT